MFVHVCRVFLTAYVASMDGHLSNDFQNEEVSNLLICYFMCIVIYWKMYIKAGRVAEIISNMVLFWSHSVLWVWFRLFMWLTCTVTGSVMAALNLKLNTVHFLSRLSHERTHHICIITIECILSLKHTLQQWLRHYTSNILYLCNY